MEKGINKIQELQLELMKLSSFNNFNGEQVVKDLIENKNKWIGCIWGRFVFFDLLPLRDISQGIWNTDTLYILTQKENIKFFEEKAKEWQADEFGWVEEIKNEKGNTKYIFHGIFEGNEKFYIRFGSCLGELIVIRIWWD
jgi:hypothetical protein